MPNGSDESKRRTIREELAQLFKKLRGDFLGDYEDVIAGLRGMSEEELADLIPETEDREVYDRLIAVVEEAAEKNRKQADLKAKIEELGQMAVRIACRVPGLDQLFPA